jgi:voltage-gated potassium channel
LTQPGAARRLVIAFGILLLLTATGTLGYVVLTDMTPFEGLYQTVTTLSTVGFMEVRPLDSRARAFTMLLIVGGVGAVLYTFATMAEFLIAGRLGEILGRRSMERSLAALEGHVIVCGWGRLGRAVTEEFVRSGVPYAVIEEDPNVAARLDAAGCPVIVASASEEGILGEAGVKRARALVAATGSEAVNVFIVLAAREENREIAIYARAETEAGARRLRSAGASQVVSPYQLAGLRLAHAIVRPAVVDFMELAAPGLGAEIDLEEVVIAAGSALAGRAIDALAGLGVRVSVVAIRRGREPLRVNPNVQTVFEPADRVVVVGDRENVTKLAELAGRPA